MFQNFEKAIPKILSVVAPTKKIDKHALSILNKLSNIFIVRVSEIAYSLTHPLYGDSKNSIKHTVGSREIQTSIRLLLTGELAKLAVSEGTKAVTRFTSISDSDKKTPNEKAKLEIPISKTKTVMKNYCHERIGSTAPVYLAATLEYILAEILELSGRTKNESISILDIKQAIVSDEELPSLIHNLHIEIPGFIDVNHERTSISIAENYVGI
jgi:histone H2B